VGIDAIAHQGAGAEAAMLVMSHQRTSVSMFCPKLMYQRSGRLSRGVGQNFRWRRGVWFGQIVDQWIRVRRHGLCRFCSAEVEV
jgi:hypothetical protein